MAEVYRAYHANLDRYVAIKILHRFLADDPEFKSRFEREAQNIARLKHPHIVQVYDFDYDGDGESYYMVMELIEGDTLKDRLYEVEQTGEPVELREALRIVREAASALSYAHRAGMIHRDVKPANLMLDQSEDSRVVLTDFGIAKMLKGSNFTVTGGLIGTPAYMSPEQGMGETGDERSDLYALGVILFQMLTGELPFDAETPLALVLKHVNEAVPSAYMLNPRLPNRVDDIIERLMAKDVSLRYQTAQQLIDDVEQLESDLDTGLLEQDADSVLPPVVTSINPSASSKPSTLDRLTVRLQTNDHTPVPGKTGGTSIEVAPVASGGGSRWMLWVAGLIGGIIILLGGYALGAMNGVFPAVAFLASETPTMTLTSTLTTTPTPTNTATDAPTATPTRTPTATPSPTDDPPTSTVDVAPVVTDLPVVTNTPDNSTPTPTPNVTATEAVFRTATFAACTFDYGIISQEPEDGEDGGFIPTNSDYSRTITLLNAGTCDWERNTSLTFVEGESFNAGPRIFIREPVPVGAEVELVFEGTTPDRGQVENGQVVPVVGTWQLRTPGQIPIGEPFDISILVFDPGS